jgi:hypothetical protein
MTTKNKTTKKPSTSNLENEYKNIVNSFNGLGDIINDHAEIIDEHGEVINSYADSWQHIREDQEVLSSRINLVFWFCGITTAIATSLAITALVCK